MEDRIRIEGDIRITVIAKLDTGDLLEEYQNVVHGPCPHFEIGNEFIANAAEKPDGFCSWAWGDIEKTVAVLALGGDVYWNKYKGTAVVCCTDAIRPVVFKLERMQ